MTIETDVKVYNQPLDETDETFMERLSRCTPERNVFVEEWEEKSHRYDDDILL